MNYDDFSEELRQGVETLIKNQLGNGTAIVRTITKNNNVRMRAISIMRKGIAATPTIYIRHYYDEYLHGRSISNICAEIFQTYETGIEKFSTDFDPEDFLIFNKIKDRIYYKLINYEMNEKLLKTLPHFKYLDMAIVFYVMVSCDDESQATALIHHIHTETWGIEDEELKTLAFSNTQEKYPAVITEMEDIISELIINRLVEDEAENVDINEDTSASNTISDNINRYHAFSDSINTDSDFSIYNHSYEDVRNIIEEEVEKLKSDRELNMYVLTNSIRTNGATCISYPDILKDFADKHQSDVYIIPSSIHEVILLPEKDLEIDGFNQMIAEVNRKELDPTEVLSDHMYMYSRSEDKIIH